MMYRYSNHHTRFQNFKSVVLNILNNPTSTNYPSSSVNYYSSSSSSLIIFHDNHTSFVHSRNDGLIHYPSIHSVATPSSTSISRGSIPDEIASLVHEYSQQMQTSVSLQNLMRTGRGEMLQKNHHSNTMSNNNNFTTKNKQITIPSPSFPATQEILQQVATFIRREMPIRLAKRIRDLDTVPYMKDMPNVQAVKDIYISSFLTLLNEPLVIDTHAREVLFARKLELLYERHSSVLVQMAKGAYQLREAIRKGDIIINRRSSSSSSSSVSLENNPTSGKDDTSNRNYGYNEVDFESLVECHAFLDRFYMSRIGIRVLAGQYLALREPPISEGYIGLIYQNTSPYEIVKCAVRDATYICNRKYGVSPQVIIKGSFDLNFSYIPTQLHYILLELLKNALRATVEHHGVTRYYDWPCVEVIIADGSSNEDLVIKVSDEGGGIPRSNMKKIWSYLFTTADPSIQQRSVGCDDDVNTDHSVEAPLAGLGYGLPISRSYARYFGGDVSIMSMEGYGTDAFVHLRRLGDSAEPLPV